MEAKPKIFYGWWIVVAGFLLTCTGIGIAINCISIFFKPVVDSLGFSRGDFSLYFTIMSMAMMVASPFIGKLMSKYNMRVLMTIFTTMLTVGFLMYSRCTDLMHFYICSIFVGVGGAGTHMMPVSMMITNWFKEKRGLALSIALTGSGFGGLVFAPFTNWLIMNYGWQNAYIVLGIILGLTTIPISIFVVRRHPSEKGLVAFGAEAGEAETTPEDLPGMSLSQALKTPGFWILGLVLFLVATMNMGIQLHIPAYLTDIGHSPTFGAFIVSLFMGVLIIGKLVLGSIFDRFGARTGMIYIFSVYIVAILALFLCGNPKLAILFGIIFGFANAIMTVPNPLLSVEMFGPKHFGVVFGSLIVFHTLGNAVGMPLSGFIYDSTGSYLPAFNLYLGLAVVSLVLVLVALSRGKAALQKALEAEAGA